MPADKTRVRVADKVTAPDLGAEPTVRFWPSLALRYVRSPAFRTLHADGAVGGLTPAGLVHLAFFSEYPAIPDAEELVVGPDGSFTPRQREGCRGIVHELEFDAIMTIDAAAALRDALTQYIDAGRARRRGC